MPLVREAVRADLARIAEIRGAVRENRLLDPSRVPDHEVLWYLDHAIFLVARDAAGDSPGGIQGFACANHQTGLIWALFVDPLAEGRGHGSALLGACLDRLRASGNRQAHLTTGATTRAAGFYVRRGFVDMGPTATGERTFRIHVPT